MNIIRKIEFNGLAKGGYKYKNREVKLANDFKVSIRLDDGNIIEAAVFTNSKHERYACISTQVGCKFGCKFCSSGKNGFKRNLTKDEIIAEVHLLEKNSSPESLDKIVFMGIGDPLDNYDNVVKSIKELTNSSRHYIGKISIATIGIPEKIDQLTNEKLLLDMVWISLHAATDKKRSMIMPMSKNYTIEKILVSAKNYSNKTRNIIWLNYLLYKGFNDTDEDIKELVLILNGNEKHFGLIITEPNNSYKNYRGGKYNDLMNFKKRLISMGLKNEIVAFVTAGQEANAGCGEFIFIPKN